VQSCWWPDNVHLTKTYGEDVPLVKANPERLEAAFHNLLSNAIQAVTGAGGKIQLRTARTAEQWAEITIADNGPGIPPELQERIFTPGVSAKDKGLGIGLWLVENFIHQFDGQIELTSSPAAGTTFTIKLQPSGNASLRVKAI
jgi:two-component system C4-dicarboxylate transport sensor histidine kinase DctB